MSALLPSPRWRQGLIRYEISAFRLTVSLTFGYQYGAYQEYTVAPASTTFQIPESISFEEAATLPLAVMTAAIGLFVVLGIPEPPKPGEEPSFASGMSLGLHLSHICIINIAYQTTGKQSSSTVPRPLLGSSRLSLLSVPVFMLSGLRARLRTMPSWPEQTW